MVRTSGSFLPQLPALHWDRKPRHPPYGDAVKEPAVSTEAEWFQSDSHSPRSEPLVTSPEKTDIKNSYCSLLCSMDLNKVKHTIIP